MEGVAVTNFTLTEGNDTFPGSEDDEARNDRIYALGGDDYIQVNYGDDTVYGGAGDDLMIGKSLGHDGGIPGTTTFYGGEGDDQLFQGHYNDGCNLFGGDGNDLLSLGHAFDLNHYIINFADGGSGDDVVSAEGFGFSVEGGSGQDTLTFALFTPGKVVFDASGNEVILTVGSDNAGAISGFENFHIQGYRDDDVMTGGDLADELDGDAGFDLIYGGGGNDTLSGETVYGGTGDDLMPGVSSTNFLARHLFGGEGNDTIGGNPAGLVVDAGTGDDVVRLEIWRPGLDTAAAGVIHGGTGSDSLDLHWHLDSGMRTGDTLDVALVAGVWTGRAAGTVVFTADGFEALTLSHIDPYYLNLVSGAGNDRVDQRYSKSRATLDMGAGDDYVAGGVKVEVMLGGEGHDTLLGGRGDDTITGGLGRDYLGTGGGRDVLVFNTLADSGTAFGKHVIDQVTYFQTEATAGAYIDRIDLSAIDAAAGVAGDQVFNFIGEAEFTAEGQVRVMQSGSATFVQVNAIGSAGSDMTICLLGVVAPQIGVEDFIL